MNAQTLIAIGSLITAAVAIIGIVPLFYSLVQANRSLRSTVYHQVLDMMEQVRNERHLLVSKLPRDATLDDFHRLQPDEQEKLDTLARACDRLGLLVKHKVVPINFVMDFYSSPIVIAWHRLEPHVREVRQQRGQSGHMDKFEMLAIEAKLHRDKNHPGEETFALNRDQLRRHRPWIVWKR